MKTAFLLSLTLLSTGCATLSRETRFEEGAWQALNAVDAVQTNHDVRGHNGCMGEIGSWQVVSGRHPSTERVAETAIIWGAAHFAVTAELSSIDAPRWLQRAWQLVTITGTGISITTTHENARSSQVQNCEHRRD